MTNVVRILGLDPGLRRTGWGLVAVEGARLSYGACGVLTSDAGLSLALRLKQVHDRLAEVVRAWSPDEAAVEETFLNNGAPATPKLGQARAIALLVPAPAGLPVAQSGANQVKKT